MTLKTKTPVITIFLLILLFFSILLWRNISELNKYKQQINKIENKYIAADRYWLENLKWTANLFMDFFNNSAYIREKTENKTSILIYRYSKYTCEKCIREDLQQIELLQKNLGKEKIMLLPAYPDNRDGKIELKNILGNFNYINIPADSLIIPTIEGEYFQRYFAVINKEGKLEMVFFPHSGNPELTQLYFSEVSKIL